VGLYFMDDYLYNKDDPLGNKRYTNKLVNIYNELRKKGEAFEIVIVLYEDLEERIFEYLHGSMPWLALPLKKNTSKKLVKYFQVCYCPTLFLIGPNGKTVQAHGRS
jgi:nucleoredoxin